MVSIVTDDLKARPNQLIRKFNERGGMLTVIEERRVEKVE